jgi:hypothetical protein
MELNELRNENQFPAFYKDKNLTNTEDKIEFLTREMDIRLIHNASSMSDEENLANLQQCALESWDRRPPEPLSGARV